MPMNEAHFFEFESYADSEKVMSFGMSDGEDELALVASRDAI